MSKKSIFLTEDEYKEDIRNIFHKFTINRDEQTKEAFLDLSVMEQMFIALERPLSQKTLMNLEREIIKDNLLGIPYNRFEEIYLQQIPYDSGKLLEEAFHIFDENDSGQISIDEVKKVVDSLSLKFTDQEIKDIFLLFDPKGEELLLDKIRDLYE